MLRIGLIGTGGISTVHLRYLKQRPDVHIAALCDIVPEHLERRQREFGGTPYADFHQMLNNEQLDAVWLCTPPQVRREPLLACARRGIPVFCEKPVERDAHAAQQIAAELAALNARVQVGYVLRCMPIVNELRAAWRDDRIHIVQSLYSCPMSLERSMPAWFFDKSLSGGALVDQATHNFDLLRYLLGEVRTARGLAANPVTPKHGAYTIDETLALTLRFESGVLATHLHSWVGDAWRNEIVFGGEQRMYRLNIFGGTLRVEDKSGTREFSQDGSRLYEFENARFLDMVISGDWSANPCTYDDGLRTLQLTLTCDAALDSLS